MNKKFLSLTGYQWTWVLYIAVALFCWQLKYFRHADNNFHVFRYSWYHARANLNLYAAYPAEYGDFYYYGPLFSLFVAPFAIPPESVGLLLWEVVNALTLLVAVDMLPLTVRQKTGLLLLCAIEFANSVFYMQFNAATAAIIIISFVLVEKQKDWWATLLIIAGALIKLYPIIGLTFFLFSKNKLTFILSALVWSGVMFALPMLISHPTFVINSYPQWLAAVSYKSTLNTGLASSQDMCVMGAVRRLTGNVNIPNMPFFIAGGIIFLLPLFRFSQFNSLKFRLQVLASCLIMVVIFSTGAEHPTFIIAVAGAFLWILIQKEPFTATRIFWIILLLVITGLGLTDAMPRYIRQDIIAKYSIKAWPCIVIWLIISYQLLFKDFTLQEVSESEKGIPIIA